MHFNIEKLIEEVWGFVPAVKVPQAPSKNQVESWTQINSFKARVRNEGSAGLYGRQDVLTSSLGTDIVFPFWLGGEKLKKFDKHTGRLGWEYVEEFQVPIASLLDFSRQKEIIRTKMSSGYGTIKELYSFGDWNLKIRGLLFDEDKEGRTMVELRRDLLRFEQFADSIPVRGWIFNELDIDRIVINSISFKQVQGKPWVMPFEMNCESDFTMHLNL